MHSNRNLSLIEYQNILQKRVSKLSFLLLDKAKDKLIVFKAKVKSLWHPDFSDDYLANRATKIYKKLRNWRCSMLTLTYSTKLYSPKEVAIRHKKDIRKFMLQCRKYFKKFEYAYFVEITKKNYIHFHIYLDQFFPVAILQQIWQQITGSIIVDIREIKSEVQARYCSDYHYMTKKFTHNQLEFAFHNISRFFGQSRNFFEKEEKEESLFQFISKISFGGINLLEVVNTLQKNEVYWKYVDELDEEFENISFKLHFNEFSGLCFLEGREAYSKSLKFKEFLSFIKLTE